MIPAFPKIFHVGAPEIRDNLFKGYVEITEKMDGSAVAWGLDAEARLQIRSKGAPIVVNGIPVREIDKLFKASIDHIMTLYTDGKLNKNTAYYGEAMCGKKHNTLTYGSVPRNNIVLYGICTDGYWLDDHEILQLEADKLDLDCVALLYGGEVTGMDQVKELLERESYYGGTKIEGFVVKNYHQSANSAFSTACFGKYVSDRFKEMNGAEWQGKHSKLDDFYASFANHARWDKAIQHLRDDGQLTDSPKDIGILIPAIINDMETELSAWIKEQLYSLYIRQIKGHTVRGFPEFYKEYLAKKSFKEEVLADPTPVS